MEPLIFLAAGGGIISGIFLTLVGATVCYKNKDIPDRRKRISTRHKVDGVMAAYRSQKLTMSQAVNRLIELEIPRESIKNILLVKNS